MKESERIVTQNVAITQEQKDHARRVARMVHGGNVSHYIRSLIQRDMRRRDRLESETRIGKTS